MKMDLLVYSATFHNYRHVVVYIRYCEPSFAAVKQILLSAHRYWTLGGLASVIHARAFALVSLNVLQIRLAAAMHKPLSSIHGQSSS